MKFTRYGFTFSLACILSLSSGMQITEAQAAEIADTGSHEAAAPAAPAPAPKPPPYSLPFQLRPSGAVNVVRSDTAFAFYESPATGESGSSVVPTLVASYKVTPELSPLIRFAFVQNAAPGAALNGSAFANPVLGAAYTVNLSREWRLGPFFGITIPVGSGGGNDPDQATRTALAAAVPARSAMDNALFAVNYFTVIPGLGLTYADHGFTAQVEATLLALTQVRGQDCVPDYPGKCDVDSARTNFTSGIHLGYFFIPALSGGVELRHQRWLSTPMMVRANDDARDTTTFAVGARLHFQVSEKSWIRPALVYARALDLPVTDAKYNNIQLDVPVSF